MLCKNVIGSHNISKRRSKCERFTFRFTFTYKSGPIVKSDVRFKEYTALSGCTERISQFSVTLL